LDSIILKNGMKKFLHLIKTDKIKFHFTPETATFSFIYKNLKDRQLSYICSGYML
jgi:hypothetical protein